MIRSRSFLALGALVLLVSSGCAASDQTAAEPAPSGTPTSQPPAASGAPAPDGALFDGECDDALSAAEASAATGLALVAVPREPLEYVWGGAAAVAVLGGVSCAWSTADQDVWVDVTIVPSDRAGDEQVALQSEGQPYCVLQRCSFSEVHGSTWIAGVVSTSVGTDPHDAIARLVEHIAPRAASLDAAAGVPPTTMPLECDALGREMGLSDLLGDGAVLVPGNGPADVSPGVYGARAAVGQVACVSDGPPYISIDVVPGAGALLATSPPAGATEVPGRPDLLMTRAVESGGTEVFAASASELIVVNAGDLAIEMLIAVAQRALAAV